MNLDPLLLIESDLLALAARAALLGGCISLAMAVWSAATVRASQREVPFAGDAAAPNQRGEESRESSELDSARSTRPQVYQRRKRATPLR